MGISFEEFKHMNPRKLEYVRDGYKQKIKQIDALNWLNGKYTMSAVAVAIEANFAKNPKGKYANQPVLMAIDKEEKRINKNAESNEEVAVYEMKQRIKRLENLGLPESPD